MDVLISIMSSYYSFLEQLSLTWLLIINAVLVLGWCAVWTHRRYVSGERFFSSGGRSARDTSATDARPHER